MSKQNPGALRRLWRFLRKPSAKWSLLTLLVVGFFGGIFFWGGFHTALEATNTLPFCISCHEMRDNVFQEYKETIHYQNRTGVHAICSDCHVPKSWGYKVMRKIQASQELWGHFDEDSLGVSVHETRQDGDVDLLDWAALRTLSTDGAAYVLPRGRIPGGGPMAALFRF